MLGMAYLSAALEVSAQAHHIEDLNLDFLGYLEDMEGSGTGEVATRLRTESAASARFEPKRYLTDPRGYLAAYQRQGAQLATWGTSSADWCFWQYGIGHVDGWSDLDAVVKAAVSPSEPIKGWLASSAAVRRVVEHRPDWVGLSVSFEGQLHLALALAHHLRVRTGAVIVLGGGLVNTFGSYIGPRTPFWSCVDGVVLGAGERVVGRMISEDSTVIPKGVALSWIRQGKWLCDVRGQRHPPPLPSFATLPLSRYRAAGTVLPYRVFSRCHWRRCAFCADNRYHFHGDACAAVVEDVVRELDELCAVHQVEGIYFLDAELPVSFLLDLSRQLRSGGRLLWGANARVHEALTQRENVEELRNGGCRFLRFGIESGSQRMLDLMGKGVTLDVASRTLEAVSGAGMVTHAYLLKGFIGETPSDWSRTVDFVLDRASWIDMLSVSPFLAYEGSAGVERNPSRFLRVADEAHWLYPKDLEAQSCSSGTENELVERLLRLRGKTRAFPTVADTILLSGCMSLDYRLGTEGRPLP